MLVYITLANWSISFFTTKSLVNRRTSISWYRGARCLQLCNGWLCLLSPSHLLGIQCYMGRSRASSTSHVGFLKNGWSRASWALRRSDGSNRNRPYSKSTSAALEWSALLDTKSFSRSSFLTALMLSLETAPSGQFKRVALLKYFWADELAFRIICSGIGPRTLSIIARCSRFSCVWNNASPEHSSTRIQPTLQISHGKLQPRPLNLEPLYTQKTQEVCFLASDQCG